MQVKLYYILFKVMIFTKKKKIYTFKKISHDAQWYHLSYKYIMLLC